MLKIKLYNTPDINWVLEDRDRIKLYAVEDITVQGIYQYHYPNWKFQMDKDVVGVPFLSNEITHNCKLYHPESSFAWRGIRDIKHVYITLLSKDTTIIPSGSLIACINLMSIQFYKLMIRHDGSDRGLRSRQIKIELNNELV